MFKKIKEFIEAFKDAYNTINVNKIDAKRIIEDYYEKVNNIENVANTMKYLYNNLIDVYRYFPKKERQDFIQKTLDLFRYGRQNDNGNFIDWVGITSLYYSKANCAKNNLAHLKELYKEGKYGEVKVLAKEYLEDLEEFYVLNNIIDNPNESKIN